MVRRSAAIAAIVIRVPVAPALLRWARERSGISSGELMARFEKLSEWECGRVQPTLEELEAFARAAHVPVGYLFLTEPPHEPVPIPDFRTDSGKEAMRFSPDLLDIVYACQERQTWYEEYVCASGRSTPDFVGSVAVDTAPEVVADDMRRTLEFDVSARRGCDSWTDALRRLIRNTEKAGVLVMVDSVVGSDSRRRLDPGDFVGFALSDPLVPLVFVNGRAAEAIRAFTLAHQLARVWLGTSALSNYAVAPKPGYRREEVWCDAVAAEFLVPAAALRSELVRDEPLVDALSRLARVFKVSAPVVLRRLLDVGWIDRRRFDVEWSRKGEWMRSLALRSDEGDRHGAPTSTPSRRFARAITASVLEGRTLYRDAFRMLGIEKTSTFDQLVRDLGVLE